MEVMQFSKEEVREILRLLAGILHLGNIEFITAGGAQVSFKTGKMMPGCLPILPFLGEN
jgi:myosin X